MGVGAVVGRFGGFFLGKGPRRPFSEGSDPSSGTLGESPGLGTGPCVFGPGFNVESLLSPLRILVLPRVK